MKQTRRYIQTHPIEGELLPPDETPRALAPWQQPTPLIRINLPQAPRDDDAPLVEHEIRKAQRQPTMQSDVHVPLAQAVITALAFGTMAALLAWALGWSWRVPVVVLALAVSLAWLWRLRLLDDLLWTVERFTGHDVNRDGQVGKPSFAPIVVNAHEAKQEAAQVQRENTNQAELNELLSFVTRCANLGCSEAAHSIGTSPSARADFARKRDALITLGVARWKDAERRRSGWLLCVSPAQAGVILRKHIMGRDST